MMTGCIGSRVTDKQPIACSIDTITADVGTTFTLVYKVYNSAGLEATVQRVISVISPCDSGQYLCGDTCSSVRPRRMIPPCNMHHHMITRRHDG